jgi:hypothetical protein
MKAPYAIKVKIIEKNNRKVKIRLMQANREMSVPTKAFTQRCERGLYDVVNPALMDSII